MDFLFILNQKKDIQTLTSIAKIMVFSKQKLKHSFTKDAHAKFSSSFNF